MGCKVVRRKMLGCIGVGKDRLSQFAASRSGGLSDIEGLTIHAAMMVYVSVEVRKRCNVHIRNIVWSRPRKE